jgi:hypothetical protein
MLPATSSSAIEIIVYCFKWHPIIWRATYIRPYVTAELPLVTAPVLYVHVKVGPALFAHSLPALGTLLHNEKHPVSGSVDRSVGPLPLGRRPVGLHAGEEAS